VGLALIEAPEGMLVSKKFIDEGTWEVEIAGSKYPCKLSLSPMYDPNNIRIKNS
jgi:sarcosine dehydrogenase